MTLSLTITGEDSKNKSVEIAESVFGQDFNEPLIHQVVTSYLTNARAGTKAQKTRAEVRGGGIKPWKQKGTGRARAGSIRSPLWRGGGIVFAAQPKIYRQKINKKMYRAAMRSILSELVRQGRVMVLASIDLGLDKPKTKALAGKLEDWKITSAFIVTHAFDENLYLSARNIPHIEVGEVIDLNPVSLIRAEKLLVTIEALKQIEELLA